MRACQIENGVVVNIIEIERLDLIPELNLVGAELGGTIGDSWDGEKFTSPPVPEPTPAPQSTKEELLAQIQALMSKVEALS